MFGKILLFGPPLIVAVVLHEVAHGLAAYLLGDPTAKSLKRLSLNPIRHVDPVMTLLLPGLLIVSGSPVVFGGAKPVPVDPSYFRNPRKGMMLVALAGPLTNFVLAAICYLGLSYLGPNSLDSFSPDLKELATGLVSGWLVTGLIINLVLAVFNLLPIPPLDGGRIACGLLPLKLARPLARLEPYGILIVFLLLLSGLLNGVIGPLVETVMSMLLRLPVAFQV